MRKWEKEFLLAEKRVDEILRKKREIPFSEERIKYLHIRWNEIISQLVEKETNKK